MAKRSYTRRSDEELIRDLQEKIERVEARIAAREREDAPVLKEIPKLGRHLRKFAQLAVDHGREDLSNMALAFLSGLTRAGEEGAPKPEKSSRAKRNNGRT